MSLTAKFMLSPLLVAQAAMTKSRLPRLPEPSGARQGVAGKTTGAPLMRLLVTGDSSAAGVGVTTQRDALAWQLGQQLASRCAAQMHWQLMARSGLTTAQTLAMLQAQQAQLLPAEIAVVVTGVNDVVDQVPSHRAVASRETLANWLRNAHGVLHVVFAPLPPVHQFPALPQPLRWIAGADALRHNHAMRYWVAERARHGQDVSAVDMCMSLNAEVMADDGFHPGKPVYRYCAERIAQHIAEHVWPTTGRSAY
jgi:lysophospholipase L1-like esterase